MLMFDNSTWFAYHLHVISYIRILPELVCAVKPQTSALLQLYPHARLNTRSREILKPRDMGLESSDLKFYSPVRLRYLSYFRAIRSFQHQISWLC